jgi:ribosomal protein S18 acetylase RimI-like enzyme
MNIKLNINKLEELDEVLEVSKKVFNPTPEEEEKYHNKEDWLKKIKNDGLLIAAKDRDSIVGFSICYSKDSGFHVWNVGVLKDYRRFGIWKIMYEAIIKFANQKDFKQLTLNTYKNKFPNMYAFCVTNGFKEHKTEKGKSFFIKSI